MQDIKYIENGPLHYDPLWWQREHLLETASGYGMRLTTVYKTEYNGRMYRVYATCFSNVASYWIKSRGEKLHITNTDKVTS